MSEFDIGSFLLGVAFVLLVFFAVDLLVTGGGMSVVLLVAVFAVALAGR